ncbi:WXG100 family type VII secretion target [Nocardia sp. NPDC024068]|uniref:WXG100 family type VII secretion target n=1 Tax=Nocardia sp. NPDC024068 TaxID=3157197 RepID=UPI00340AD571
MGDTTSADPELLRAAAGRLDVLFGETGAALGETDQDIAESAEGWKDTASAAFGRFNGYLEGRRKLLQTNLGEMSELLRTTADSLESRDQATGQTLAGQPTPGPTSLDL